jgi:hypothetical protein
LVPEPELVVSPFGRAASLRVLIDPGGDELGAVAVVG